jgi:hypothetical protein
MTTLVIPAAVMLFVVCGPGYQAAAPAQTGQQQTGTLDKLLAPIALYPDQLLAQMLMSATEPAKVTELNKWLKANQTLKGTQLQDAAVKAEFGPSFVALVLFPQVVTYMAEQISWTTQLGQAFASDRSSVFDAIQRLRHQAQQVGTLKTTAQQEVSTKATSSGEQVIVIEPTNPQVVYVPQYNPTVVYTQPPTQTVVIQEEDDDSDEAVAAGLIGFTAGIAIGAAMDNNYYYGPYGWHGGAYMYNDAWDDYYDAREDAREDWQDHREDISEERGERRESTQEQRTERQQTRAENRPETAQRTQSAQTQSATTGAQGTSGTTSGRTGSAQARGYSSSGSSSSSGRQTATQRTGSSDAFSGYSSGRSQRSASARGQRSRSMSRGGGRGRRR